MTPKAPRKRTCGRVYEWQITVARFVEKLSGYFPISEAGPPGRTVRCIKGDVQAGQRLRDFDMGRKATHLIAWRVLSMAASR